MIDPITGKPSVQGTLHVQPTSAPAVSAQDIAWVRSGLALMGHELHQALAAKFPEKSFVFSPISIAPVLGMLLRGMDRPEAKQILLAKLGLAGANENVVHQCLGMICAELVTEGSGNPKIRVANGVTGSLNEIKEDYLQDLKKHYGAEVFSDQGNLLTAVNNWVSEKTEGMVPQILTQVPPLAFLCIMNALYFEADWSKIFDAERTRPMPFADIEGSQVPVMMMKSGSSVRYCELDDVQFVEKDYEAPDGQRLSFMAILPKNPGDFARLERSLDPAVITRLRNEARSRKVELTFPKMDFEARVDGLKDLLEGMGLPMSTSFRNIHDAAILDSIVHQVRMQVDEKGTKAAAATVATMRKMCMPFEPPPVFTADRPFFLMVAKGEDILFRGSIKDAEFLVKKSEGSLEETLVAVAKNTGLDLSQLDPQKSIQHISKGGKTFYIYNLTEQNITFDEENRLMVDGALVTHEIPFKANDPGYLHYSDDDGVMLFVNGPEPALLGEEALLFYNKDFNKEKVDKKALIPKKDHWVASAKATIFRMVMGSSHDHNSPNMAMASLWMTAIEDTLESGSDEE